MASTKKGLTARVAAGFGAVALATLTALGGALPASAAPNIDPQEPGSIIIHKFEQPVERGDVGTGLELGEDALAGLEPVAGVEFTVTRVTSLDVLDNDTWAKLGVGLTGADVVNGVGGPYEFGTPVVGSTDGDGLLEVDGLPVGVYLVQESAVPAPSVGGPNVVIQPAPFLVVLPQVDESTGDWFYDVHVYPKNTTALASKSVSAPDHQVLGTTIEWAITSHAPVPSQGTALTSYVVRDDLAAQLDYVEGSIVVTVAGTALELGDDYTLSAPGGAGGTLSVTFTGAGRQALLDNPGAEVSVTFDTAVVAVSATGAIANTGAVVINGTTVPTNTVTDHWGAVELFKHDASERGLSGAVFELRDSSGVALLDGSGDPIRYTSGANGVIAIDGLRTASPTGLAYQLVEITAPSGYVLPANPADRVHSFTVAPGTPAGYEVTVENEQVPPYQLPVTGGTGQVAFMIGGFGLVALALGFALARRRKEQAQA
ncbi:SpaH/EbpB family LPXTG-anchored major pilin [Agrococcus carbonis]|uniref:LPXTG-motif cell wall anchor domain-containing protein/fimbrial isopeptide formation D2 domain-containing protein n=1 Tax=Agrococcus carbonis TaxID=684552 RepID=A0A1H1N7J6_9MICO|nr:SpaH/EbpB family LPXTG-anchored major pilin [Agrococcus carbonis]SDR94944.1 LPXTG-motif cell wall anchor domain-containing protein/fimbrial isopeptide formation D2 domain-containing protein [Agrococcus carbonis]